MGWKSHAVKFNYRHLISSHLSSPSSSPPALESFSNPSFSLNPNPKYLIRIKSSCLNHLIDRKNLNSNLHNACRIPKPSSVFFFFLYYPIVSAKWLPFWPPKNLLSLIFNRNPNSNHFIVERSSDVNSTVSRKPFRHFLVASSLHSLSHFPEIPSFVTSDGNSRSRLFSSSSYGRNPKSGNSHRNHGSRMLKLNPDEVMEIVELIERGDDIEKSLKQMNMRLSVASISKIISLLSDRGVPVLAFFECIQKTHLDFNSNAEIYNQLINNFGSLQDYESMHALLMELSLKRHCLTEKAFGFLRVFNYNQVQESVERVLDILNRIRGSCRSSGNYMLIKVLCGLNYFDLAIFVMAGTVKKTSYYNVLIAAKCRKGDFQDASNLFVEMKRFGCDPNASSYNYLLGSLCKKGKIGEACELLEVVENSGYLPDSITFEIFVVHACRLGKMDDAIEFLHQMMLMRLKPRITTHAAFIKGYFFSRRVHDAYKYVAEMSGKDKFSSNMNYSLLASLFQKSGRVVEARDVVLQMIEEGLKPKFSVYMRVIKDLYKTGKGDLIADLKCKFSKFHSITENGGSASKRSSACVSLSLWRLLSPPSAIGPSIFLEKTLGAVKSHRLPISAPQPRSLSLSSSTIPAAVVRLSPFIAIEESLLFYGQKDTVLILPITNIYIEKPSVMDTKHSVEMLKHLEKQGEVLMEAYRSMSHELHRLQVEEEMLMCKFFELMSAQGLIKKNENEESSLNKNVSGEHQLH